MLWEISQCPSPFTSILPILPYYIFTEVYFLKNKGRIFSDLSLFEIFDLLVKDIFLVQGSANYSPKAKSWPLFFYGLRVKGRLFLLNYWSKIKIKRKIIICGRWKLYKIQMLLSTIKFLLELNHTHSFTHCLRLFPCSNRVVEQLWHRPHVALSLLCTVVWFTTKSQWQF